MGNIKGHFRPKFVLSIALFALVALLLANYATSSTIAAPGNSTQAPLQSIPVFKDSPGGQWVGYGDGDFIENTWGALPIDTGNSLNGLPSYKLNVTGGNDGFGWWLAILAGASWESYSIEPYVSGGALEFNIKSDSPVVDFELAVSDVVFERNPKYCEPTKVALANYVTVNSSWQHVRIPLVDLVPNDSCSNIDQGSTYASGTFDPTQIYSIVLSGAGGADFVAYVNDIEWTSPDSEPVFAPIKVNQLGYTPNSPKYALVSGFSDVMLANNGDTFEVRRASDNAIVFTGSLALLSENDGASGERVLKADFSDLLTPGQYIVTVPGYLDSAEFTISATAFDSLVQDSMHYFLIQRQGVALSADMAGIYERGVGHPQDNAAVFESNNSQTLDVMKGWYDAGDYGKYVNAGATTVSDLLWTYELFPNEFPDNHLNIPESGNGTPDILDEVRWELEWMLKMQDTDGGFYHMVKSKAPDGGEWDSDTTPDISPDVRYIRDSDVSGYGNRTNVKPTSVTASAVAAMAHAAIVFESHDPAFAATLLQSARDGWAYLDNNQTYISTIKGAPYTIPYEDYQNASYTPDYDDRVWAAAALFRATGETPYRDYVDGSVNVLKTGFTSTTENAYGVGNVEIPAVLMYFAASNQTPSVLASFTSDFTQWQDHMMARADNGVWQHTLDDEDYYWGSNYPNLTTPLALAVGTKMLGTYSDDIVNLSRQSLNYTLGINPMQFSYVSGYGENSLERPFSQMFNFDGKPGVPAGIMVGGANEYNNAFLYSSFPGKKFSDNAAAWSTNEHTVYWNAVLVFHAALAAHEADSLPPEPTPTPDPNATATPLPPTSTPAPTAVPTDPPTATPLPPTATPTEPPTATPVPTEPPPAPNTVAYPNGETTAEGVVSNGSFTALAAIGGPTETLRETETGGKKSTRKSLLVHTWTFNVTGNDEVTLETVASRPDNSEGDDFTFAWSTNGNDFTTMFTVDSASMQSYSFALPANTDGTVYVRVVDTDSAEGNRVLDDLLVDYMAITSASSVVPTPEPTIVPTVVPTAEPTVAPTAVPTIAPTAEPTIAPTAVPTIAPTAEPTIAPTAEPTIAPTAVPTVAPTSVPTVAPTAVPTIAPTVVPPPPTPTAEPPSLTTDLVSSEYAEDGNLSQGSYVDTRLDDGVAEAVIERQSGGKPANRTSYIDYRWQINVTGSGALTLEANAWAEANDEGDVFTMGYSTDGINFVDMFDLGTSEATHTYALPDGINGTLTIRVTDSDQKKGSSNRESVYVDFLAVHSSSGGRGVLSARPAELAVPDAVVVTRTSTVTYPVFYTGDGKLVQSLSMAIAFDGALAEFDSADSDGNNLPDGLELNLPAGFSATSTLSTQNGQTTLALDIVADGAAMPLNDGLLGLFEFVISNAATTDSLVTIELVDGTVDLRDGADLSIEMRSDSGSLYVVAEASVPTSISLGAAQTGTAQPLPLMLGVALIAAMALIATERRMRRQP